MSSIKRETRMLIGIQEVPYVYWNEVRGKRLKMALGKNSSYEVSEKMQALGHNCSRQYVDKIVKGNSQSISTMLLLSICKTFNIDATDVIPVQIETETKEVDTESTKEG